MITSKTKPTFIIGNPVAHSKSPVFQNEAFKFLDIDSVYLALNIEKNDFDEVIGGLKKLDIFGMNVTIPYKKDIIKFCDELSPDAQKIEAVNTIEIKDKKWIGHNTDWYGVYETLSLNKIANDVNVLIIGAGGATNGVVYGLQKYGVSSIAITNRTDEKAQDIAKLFGVDVVDYSRYEGVIDKYNLIINSTSLDFGDLISCCNEKTFYFDLKYYNSKPSLPNYIDGTQMLLYQGAKAFEIWTKIRAPIEVMRKAFGGLI